jgi:hypothetical protein
MHNLSFDPRDPLFTWNGLTFGVQLFTYENIYGLRRDHCDVQADATSLRLVCQGLTWAGGQAVAEGWVSLQATAGERTTTFVIEASCARTIRCVKLILKNLPPGVIVNLREAARQEIPLSGLILKYPDGWRGLYTPLLVFETEAGQLLYVRSLDSQVREKRFALLRRGNAIDIELIFEELAPAQRNTISIPAWEIGTRETLDEIMHEQAGFIQRTYGLVPWEQRPDVPTWAREIALVATIHCQHWSGYIFNDYARVLNHIRWLASKIEPRRILAYLPGWEGRYYWQYGDYRPDPRMGGERGFEHLVKQAQRLGVRVMPMFGINYANRGLENFEQWGAPAHYTSASGLAGGGTCDWDSSRHYDHGWGALLNPGAPTWQNRLTSQIVQLLDRYGFDGVFLDISAGWWNDPKHPVYEGTLQLIARLRERHPNVLIAGEGWYDGIGAATPLVQAGHTDGTMHWHDQPAATLFDTYHRCFAHLCLGDPGRASTGVHELGHNPWTRTPLRKGIIPTVAIVEDTLERAPDAVLEVIEAARRYAARYLTEERSEIQAE